MALASINPATGELLESFPEMDAAEVRERIDQAHRTWLGWRETPFARRAELMRGAAAQLREN